MLNDVTHIGLTVVDIEVSKKFYGEVLGLDFLGEMIMEGPNADALFGHPNSTCKVAYFKDKNYPQAPAIELLQFVDIKPEVQKTNLRRTSVSEICFNVKDIDAEYKRLIELGVEFVGEPQDFDSTAFGLGMSRAVYMYDPDGIIIELTQTLD